MSGSTQVISKQFDNLKEATDFANKQPLNSVFEIKLYDYKTSNVQD